MALWIIFLNSNDLTVSGGWFSLAFRFCGSKKPFFEQN